MLSHVLQLHHSRPGQQPVWAHQPRGGVWGTAGGSRLCQVWTGQHGGRWI